MVIKLSQLWLHGGGEDLRVPKDVETRDIQSLEPGDTIGPLVFEVDVVPVRSYSMLMGVDECIDPLVPARHADPVWISHFPAGDGRSNTANARMMIELFHPTRVGDVITVTGTVLARYERRGKPYIVIAHESVDSEGRVHDRLRKTYLLKRSEVAKKWDFLKAD